MLNSLFFFLADPHTSFDISYSLPDLLSLDKLLSSSDLRDFALQSDTFKDHIKPYEEERVDYYYGYNKDDQHCDLPANWYSPETAFMIYSQVSLLKRFQPFLFLDEDQNGLLTKEDLMRFSIYNVVF